MLMNKYVLRSSISYYVRCHTIPSEIKQNFDYFLTLKVDVEDLNLWIAKNSICDFILIICLSFLLFSTEVVEHCCGIPSHFLGHTLAGVAKDLDIHSYRVPLGVTAGITPFNFPAMIPLWMFPVALACGNTHVIKVCGGRYRFTFHI